MVVGQREIMEKGHKYEGVGQKATSDIRIRKRLVAHRIIVKTYDFIDAHLAVQYFRLGPYLSAKGPQPKLTVVIVSDRIKSSVVVLCYFVSFDVLGLISTY